MNHFHCFLIFTNLHNIRKKAIFLTHFNSSFSNELMTNEWLRMQKRDRTTQYEKGENTSKVQVYESLLKNKIHRVQWNLLPYRILP